MFFGVTLYRKYEDNEEFDRICLADNLLGARDQVSSFKSNECMNETNDMVDVGELWRRTAQ